MSALSVTRLSPPNRTTSSTCLYTQVRVLPSGLHVEPEKVLYNHGLRFCLPTCQPPAQTGGRGLSRELVSRNISWADCAEVEPLQKHTDPKQGPNYAWCRNKLILLGVRWVLHPSKEMVSIHCTLQADQATFSGRVETSKS